MGWVLYIYIRCHYAIAASRSRRLVKVKMLSYRRVTALQGALVLSKSGRLELGDNIYGHFRSIFNHCNIIGLQSHRIR